jgi:hypothetical protein
VAYLDVEVEEETEEHGSVEDDDITEEIENKLQNCRN